MMFETLRGAGSLKFGENYHLEEIVSAENISLIRERIIREERDRYNPSIIVFPYLAEAEDLWVTSLALYLYGAKPSRLFFPNSNSPAYLQRRGTVISEREKVSLLKEERRAVKDKPRRLKEINLDPNSLEKEFADGNCLIMASSEYPSRNGSLLPAEADLGLAVRVLDRMISSGRVPDAVVIPVGIDILTGRLADGRRRLRMTIGKPLTPAEIKAEAKALVKLHELPGFERKVVKPNNSQLAHTVMLELANLEINKGVYDPSHPLFRHVIRDKVLSGNDGHFAGLINWPPMSGNFKEEDIIYPGSGEYVDE